MKITQDIKRQNKKSINHNIDIGALKNSPLRFLNRELSWLSFNERVLEEAENLKYPVLERLRFLSISAANLDEFYSVRVAGLLGQVKEGIKELSADGLSAKQQLSRINERAGMLMTEQQRVWGLLRTNLNHEGISIINSSELNVDDMSWLENHFLDKIFPLLTPTAADPAHPFPFIPNLGFTLILQLSRDVDAEPLTALLPLPGQLPRFAKLPGDHCRFISLENEVGLFLQRLFPGYSLINQGKFRILRDSDIEIAEEAEDLVASFELAIKRRRRGDVIRLKVDSEMPDELVKLVEGQLGVEETLTHKVNGILGLADTSQLIIDDRPDLLFTPYQPRYPERIKECGGNIYRAIRKKDFIVHHPYESFRAVIDFLSQAAADPRVVAIKQTLYRVGNDSQIVSALIEAAEAGKSVTALVELKARFDEATNLRWARDLERAGVHVVYGFVALKTHAKISLVVRKEKGVLKSYVHLATGNYHPYTAKIYTDLSLFSADLDIVRDAAHVFNFTTGTAPPEKLKKLVISPHNIRAEIIKRIDAEIHHVESGRPGAIWAKLNSLVDDETIDALYRASQKGVKIELIVRGICCLRPGIPNFSDNINVRSIVGRFLEHSRIVCFGDGYGLPSKKGIIFISSADWMPRNFDRRVEVLVPIQNPTVHSQVIDEIFMSNLRDEAQSWISDEAGNYRRNNPEGFSCHSYFMTNSSLSGRGGSLSNND